MTPEQVNAEPFPFARLMGVTVTRTDPDCVNELKRRNSAQGHVDARLDNRPPPYGRTGFPQ